MQPPSTNAHAHRHTHSRKKYLWSGPQISDTQMLIVSTSWLELGKVYSGTSSQKIHAHSQNDICTWILFLANSRWWISLGQSCMTVVSCLSWQSRYFSPASMYSLHSWACRLITPALPLPRTWSPAPLSVAPDRGALRSSADPRRSRKRMVGRRCMTAGERKGGLLLFRSTSEDCGQLIGVTGHGRSVTAVCLRRKKNREDHQYPVNPNWLTRSPYSLHLSWWWFYVL